MGITINNSNQTYNFNGDPIQGDLSVATISNPVTIKLKGFGNYFRHENPIIPIPVLAEDMYIRIDDTLIKWKKGQTIRLSFKDKIGNFPVSFEAFIINPSMLKSPLFRKLTSKILVVELQ